MTSLIAANILFNKTIPRSESSASATKLSGGSWDKHRRLLEESRKWLDNQPCEQLSITSFDGLRLSGYYYPVQGGSDCLVIAFNGYRSNSRGQYSHITKYLNGLGIDVLLVDNRAHGESEGEYVGFGVLDRLDCQKWVEFMNEKLRRSRSIYLYGVSMGGATVLMATGLGLPEEVRGVISDCGFTSPRDVFKHVLSKRYHLPPSRILEAANKICLRTAKYDIDGASAIEAVKSSTIPLLVIHGEKDDFVPAWMAPEIYNASAAKKKQLLMVKGAYHAESYFIDMETYKKSMLDFINETKN